MKLRSLMVGMKPADCDKIPGITFTSKGAMVTPDQAAVLAKRQASKFELLEGPQYSTAELPPGLFPFQHVGVNFVVNTAKTTGSALLADDMGLGKSMQALFSAANLGPGQVVICCPRSVALSWAKEVKKWRNIDAVVVKTGDGAAKVTDEPFVITSYELAAKLDVMPHVLILDEAHQLRGRNTQRTKRIKQLAALSTYRIGLTGTPVWDRPRDFWSLLDLLWPGRFGNRWDFDLAYCNGRLNEWGGLENKGATLSDELKLRLETGLMLRRTRDQVKLDLPELQRQIVWIEPDAKASGGLRRQFIMHSPGDMFAALEATLEAKIDAAVEEALSTDTCLVFTWTRAHATEIHRRIVAEGKKAYLVHGGMTAQFRNKQIAQATKEHASVVATIDATGTGVDGLQHVAHCGIFHALDWRPLQLAQAEARLARIGQPNAVVWKYLALKDSVDEVVMSTIIDKLDQARGILGYRSNEGLRNALADSSTADEAALLAELYARMGDT